ncbi:MAG: methyltransferase domain-containing protein [Thermoanaerobaculia bacterium]
MDQWLRDNLVCPRDHLGLDLHESVLVCGQGHRYPVVDGIPVMLLSEVEQTLWVASASLTRANAQDAGSAPDEIPYADTLGIDPDEREQLRRLPPGPVDPVVQMSIAKTCGRLYAPVIGRLTSYPIPELRLPPGHGARLLDIGCNWGRWSIAAARLGYDVVGIDPSLGAVITARRVCAQLGLAGRFVVADARYLPFAPAIFDVGFSYGVLQHIDKDLAQLALAELGRVVRPGATVFIQLAHLYGVRSLTNYARRGFRAPVKFDDIRYWTLAEMKSVFTRLIGPTSLSVDAYFGLGIQSSDVAILPLRYRMVVRSSGLLRRMSLALPFMRRFADSIYVTARRNGAPARPSA